jgi:hypothetical protein
MRQGPLLWLAATLSVVSFGLVLSPDGMASCGVSVPVLHAEGSYFACSERGAVGASAWLLEDPLGVNSDGADILCEAQGAAGCSAQTGAGAANDGQLAIEGDWFDVRMQGCPIVDGVPHRIALIVANGDGQTGWSLLVSLGGSFPNFGYDYVVETAQQYDAFTGDIFAPACEGAVSVIGTTPGSITLKFRPVRVYTDCDAGSVGEAFGICAAPYAPVISTGPIRST